MSEKFRGAGVALVTPFKTDGQVDFDALGKLVEFQIQGGTDYLVIMGTTGENPTLSSAEKQQIFDKVKEVNNGRLPLVAGIGGNNTAEVVENLKAFNFEGIDGTLSVSPYYNKPNQNGIYNHYMAVADNSPRPVIVYNVPGRTGSNILAETQLRIAEHANVCATKEASGNFSQVMEIIRNKPDNFLVLSGDDDLTLPYIAAGMDGVISVILNGYPKPFSSMVHLALAGKFEEARALHYKLVPMINAIFADGSPGGIKEAMKLQGLCETTLRAPLANVNDNVKNTIKRLHAAL